MEEEDNIIVKWAQEDVETSYNLLNNNNIYIYMLIQLNLPAFCVVSVNFCWMILKFNVIIIIIIIIIIIKFVIVKGYL